MIEQSGLKQAKESHSHFILVGLTISKDNQIK